jgi:hypothetical protein|tara:strand:+ start:543 stop:782 length:240 start_codon:yes stop_codon:yes gene_type:complete
MTYNVELDIDINAIDMVEKFATSHGCTHKIIELNGPAGGNPLVQFSSDNFDHLEELIEQYFGEDGALDEESIKTMVWES